MAQMKMPSSPKISTTYYNELLGVDYNLDKTEISAYHSPSMVNMISDEGGNPIKRYGIRSIGDAVDKMTYKGGKYYSISRGYFKVYLRELEWENYAFTTVSEYDLDKDSEAFNMFIPMNGSLYTKSPTLFIKFDIEDATLSTIDIEEDVGAIDSSIVPTTLISLKPDGTDGAVLDDVNIFTPYQMNSFVADGTSTNYVLSSAKIGGTVKAEILQTDGTWLETSVTLGTGTSVTAKNRDGTTYTETIYDGTVTFATAPAVPTVAGADNVRITFSSFNNEDYSTGVKIGFFNQTLLDVLSSDVSTIYNSRLFVGVGDRVYYSNVNNPNIISDLQWFDVDDEVMGFSPFSSYLAIVCKENGNNTIFLASSTTLNDVTTFKVDPTSSGIGAVAKKSFDSLNDEPMFIANTGVYTILTNWYSRNFTYNRSTRINKGLTRETNIKDAVCATCNNYYYIFINQKAYVLDGRHKNKDPNGQSVYESYYLEDLPFIKDAFVFENKMYMVDDTSMYVWNDDIEGNSAYQDYGTVTDGVVSGGNAVKCLWSSKLDSDGDPQILKTLNKKGTMISVAPYSQSSVALTLVKDGDVREYVGKYITSSFSWENLAFSTFTFDTNEMIKDKFPRKKIKKYKRLQVILENNEIEPFGVIAFIKSYTYGNFAKR